MNREYYEQYRQIELGHWWFQGRERILKHLIHFWLPQKPTGTPLKILNVGCATGRPSEWLREFCEVSSIEYYDECAEMARLFTGMNIEQGNAKAVGYPYASFDLVTAFDVLEHIPHDSIASAELVRVCAPGGLVLVTVPAFQELWSEHDDINQHCRRYRVEGISALFADTGSKGTILKAGYFNFWLFPAVALVRFLYGVTKYIGLRKNAAPVSDYQRAKTVLFAPLLRTLLASERHLLPTRGWSFPFGISAFVAWRASEKAV